MVLHRALSSVIVALFASATASASDWYVDAAAPPGGTGSAASPFQKVGDAVNVASSGDRVLVAAGTYKETLNIATDLTILGDPGGGTILKRMTLHVSVVTASGPNLVWLQDLTITHGDATFGGGIANSATMIGVRLRVQDCTVRGFVSDAAGGGIDNSGTLVLWNSVVDSCVASFVPLGGRNFSSYGGAIRNTGTLRLFDTTISNNLAFTGFPANGTANGGGVYSTGVLHVVNSTISQNGCDTYFYGSSGGGICVAGGSAQIESSTVAMNYVRGGKTSYGAGISGNADVTNSVIAGNSDPNYSTTGPDFYGTCNSLGYLLIGDDSACTITGNTTGVQVNLDPKLLALADNGGFVQTHALDPTSPCLDAGNPDPLLCPATDARLYPRALWDPSVGICDLGAYESGGQVSFLFTATPHIPVPAGGSVALTTGGGIALHPVMVALVDVNGTPLFTQVAVATFDPSGVLLQTATVPTGLSGITATFQSFSLDASGRLEASNRDALTFQ